MLSTEEPAMPHNYVLVLEEKARRFRQKYLNRIKQVHQIETSGNAANLLTGVDVIMDVQLNANDLSANCDMLKKQQHNSSIGTDCYEPTIIVGTHQISKEQKLSALFVGYVLGQLQNQMPETCTIVGVDASTHKVDIKPAHRILEPMLNVLRDWVNDSSHPLPQVLLNKKCSTCQFKKLCLEKAEEADDLSLLDRITPKIINKYHNKGIFTITQLSYVFKPRRNRKRRTNAAMSFNFELQALALRTRKIYVQVLPTLNRQEVELFLDFEGIPDQGFQYLIGLMINEHGTCSYHSFWADTPADEEQIWYCALEKMNTYPEAPIYHYGSYEPRAIVSLSKKYPFDCENIKTRLVNLSKSIYGKLYFPCKSNSLKELGKLIGASWTDPDASGLQSLVWRHRWEDTGENCWQKILISYNREDCEALWLLTEEISKIIADADSYSNIDFANKPKQYATEHSHLIHETFETIIRSAHADYEKRQVIIRLRERCVGTDQKKRSASKGHLSYERIPPSKADAVVLVEPRQKCPTHQEEDLFLTEEVAEKYIIDLRFMKTGCKKTVTKYIGVKSYCSECHKHYLPPKIEELGSQLFGHYFQAWVIYERIVLRLPYRIILLEMENLFNESVSEATLVKFMKYFVDYYTETEKLSIQRMLESPFIHVDETTISIRGVDHYVWVFTDGKRVAFKMTETREATLVHEFLANYKGVLISDFYGGYDAATCRQQKCLVHLIRDLNNDLWSNPYNQEYELFVTQVKNLLAPIFESESKYGLKKWHLSKFKRSVDQFYQININITPSTCDIVAKYQKRFTRYRNSLFTFLEFDGIPWHNNTAENAIRHLAVQRKISGSFFKNVAIQYLLLLGVAQTCRFQKKSVLKFFLSKEIDIEKFKTTQRVKISRLVERAKRLGENDGIKSKI